MKKIRKEKKNHKWLKRIMITFVILLGLGLAGGSYIFYSVIKETPNLTVKQLKTMNATKIYDKSGNLLFSTGYNSRDYVPYNDIPNLYKDALISTEDRTFWTNPGVNFKSTLYAILGELSGGRLTQRGGSTITQQLIKLSLYSTSNKDRTIKRKIQEIWLALQITHTFSKKQILTYYVNKIYEGNDVYGAQTISKMYYGKPLSKLNLAQTAYIAGIGQAPGVYNLYTNPKACQKRKHQVLANMYANKKITLQQYKDADKVNLTDGLIPQEQAAKNNSDRVKLGQSYISSVINECYQLGLDPHKYGYKIYTDYDPHAQQIITNQLNNNPNFNTLGINGCQAAATLADPNNGKIEAQVGGRNLNVLFGLNRATQRDRSSGSTIKPLVDYGPAIQDLHWATNHILYDTPYTYKGTNIKLYDWDHLFQGPITMRKALAESRNVPAVRTLDAVGSANAKEFLSKMDCDVKDYYGGSDAIGLNVSTADLACAYAAIDNGGTYYTSRYITKIVTPEGKTINYGARKRQAMKPSTAYILNSLLSSVMQSPYGTAYNKCNLNNVHNVAGKTGTVQYDSSVGAFAQDAVSDSWITAYTSPDPKTDSGLVLSIWTGYDQPNINGHQLKNKQPDIAMFLWRDIMNELVQGQQNPKWQMPNNVQVVAGNPDDFSEVTLAPITKNLIQPRTNTITVEQDEAENYWLQKGVKPNVQAPQKQNSQSNTSSSNQ